MNFKQMPKVGDELVDESGRKNLIIERIGRFKAAIDGHVGHQMSLYTIKYQVNVDGFPRWVSKPQQAVCHVCRTGFFDFELITIRNIVQFK